MIRKSGLKGFLPWECLGGEEVWPCGRMDQYQHFRSIQFSDFLGYFFCFAKRKRSKKWNKTYDNNKPGWLWVDMFIPSTPFRTVCESPKSTNLRDIIFTSVDYAKDYKSFFTGERCCLLWTWACSCLPPKRNAPAWNQNKNVFLEMINLFILCTNYCHYKVVLVSLVQFPLSCCVCNLIHTPNLIIMIESYNHISHLKNHQIKSWSLFTEGRDESWKQSEGRLEPRTAGGWHHWIKLNR